MMWKPLRSPHFLSWISCWRIYVDHKTHIWVERDFHCRKSSAENCVKIILRLTARWQYVTIPWDQRKNPTSFCQRKPQRLEVCHLIPLVFIQIISQILVIIRLFLLYHVNTLWLQFLFLLFLLPLISLLSGMTSALMLTCSPSTFPSSTLHAIPHCVSPPVNTQTHIHQTHQSHITLAVSTPAPPIETTRSVGPVTFMVAQIFGWHWFLI